MANKSGKGGFKENPRNRNNAGQRNAAAVAFNRTLREIIASVGNEELTAESGRKLSRIELAVRGLYKEAAGGDVSAFNALVERVEGKITQPVGSDPDAPLMITVREIKAHAED